jgi:hypothetical protein
LFRSASAQQSAQQTTRPSNLPSTCAANGPVQPSMNTNNQMNLVINPPESRSLSGFGFDKQLRPCPDANKLAGTH